MQVAVVMVVIKMSVNLAQVEQAAVEVHFQMALVIVTLMVQEQQIVEAVAAEVLTVKAEMAAQVLLF